MDINSWKNCVHSSYWDTVTCHFTEESGAAVYISTKEGAFIEFCKGVIERSCLIECGNVVAIEKFFTYRPLLKYFLLKGSGKLIIICDLVDLKVVRVHSGIKKYEIGDFNEVGTPQVKVWSIDHDNEPFMVNFSELSGGSGNISTNHNHDYLCGRLQMKLKETKEMLSKFIKEVEAKKKLHAKAMLRLIGSNAVEVCHPPKEMECFFGNSDAENYLPTETCGSAVKICHQWQTIVNRKWLLGIVIRNSSERNIAKFKVFLCESPKQRNYYSVKRLNSVEMGDVLSRLELTTPKISTTCTILWQEEAIDSELPPGKGCVLICVFPFPEFSISSKIYVSGRLSYSNMENNETSGIYSQEFPVFEITPRNVLNCSLQPQGPHKILLQCISTIAVSELAILNVTVGVAPSRSLIDGIVSNIGFSPTKEDNFFLNSGLQNSSLEGCVIQIIPNAQDFEMRLYARSSEIICLLVYSILEAIPGSWSVRHCSNQPSSSSVCSDTGVTVNDCSDSLSKEIECIIYHTSKWKKNQSSSKVSVDSLSYSRFKKALCTLQKKTDMIFSKFESETNRRDHVVYH